MANVSSSNGLEKYPKLRFKGFSEPWKTIHLSDISTYRKERTETTKTHYVSTENMLQNFLGLEPYTDNSVVEGILFRKNDTLLANIRPYLRKTWFATEDGACSTDVLAIHPTNVDSKFLYNVIAQNSFIDYVMSGAKGSKMPRGDKVHIMEYELSIPTDVYEQKKIADFLKLLTEHIEKIHLLIEHLKKYKRGLSEIIFSSLSCPITELSNVCDIIGGGTPDTGILDYWNGDICWFTPTEIGKKKYVVSSARKITMEGLNKSSAKMLPPYTVLLTTRATLGEMSIVTTNCCTNQGFQSLVARKENVLPEYLYYLQTIIKPWCEKYSSGNTFREISKSALGKCSIPVPSLDEQARIVGCLSLVDAKIENCELMLENLMKIKSALVQRLFI